LTEGSDRADFLKLARLGATPTDAEAPTRERTRGRFQLAIMETEPFASLYDSLKGNELPAQQVMRDHFVKAQQLDSELAKEAVELFTPAGPTRPVTSHPPRQTRSRGSKEPVPFSPGDAAKLPQPRGFSNVVALSGRLLNHGVKAAIRDLYDTL
jgi:hypothetical protein